MKADELMVDDWVYMSENDIPRRITDIGRFDLISSYGISCYVDSIHPIPITPEILEKNGFERRDDLVERIEDPLPFIYEDKETTESVSVGWRDSYDNGLRDENAEYFEEYWKIWIDAFDARYEKTARILYVHELQHALRICGIEKEIVL